MIGGAEIEKDESGKKSCITRFFFLPLNCPKCWGRVLRRKTQHDFFFGTSILVNIGYVIVK